jgi:hypothetical protein
MAEEQKNKELITKKNFRKTIRLARIFSKKNGPSFADWLEMLFMVKY